MTTAPPLPDQPLADPEQSVVSQRKSRSVKQFLLANSANLAIGAGLIGTALLVAWLARNQLASTSLSAFLRSKGIPAEVTIENLQFDTAQIRNLRLGPADKPSLLAKNTIIKWRVDSKAKLFIVERLAVEGVTLGIAIDGKGKPDFGALAPLMTPSSGPKRSVISNVTLSNATLLVDTPQGQASARLTAWGGEAVGWTGRADITPPVSMIATSNGNRSTFVPIRAGFGFKSVAATTPNGKPTNLIGFSVLPKGQSVSYSGYSVTGITGNLTGLLSLGAGGALRVDTRPTTLQIGRLAGQDLDVYGLNITTNPIFWSQNGPWQSTGWGNVVASGSFNGLDFAPAKLQAGATQFRLGAARAQSGRMQLDYQGTITRLSGPISGERIMATGFVASNLKDLAKLDTAEFFGKGKVSASGVTLPPALRSSLARTTPPAVLSAVKGTFSSAGSFDYRITPANSQVSLSGPLTLAGSTGLRASWVPEGRGAPALISKIGTDGKSSLSGLGAGQIAFDLPALGSVRGQIDGASFGPNGWALIGRNVSLQPQALPPSLSANIEFDRINVSTPRLGTLSGKGSGRLLLSTTKNGRASLGFDLSATPSTLAGSIQGPVEGFGEAFGAPGYGARGGQLNLTGRANRQNQGWQFDAQGLARANSLATNRFSVASPNINLAGAGQLNDQGRLVGRISLSGTAARAAPLSGRTPVGLGQLALNGTANLNGTLAAMNLSGSLTSSLSQGRVGEINVEAAKNETQFSGLVGGTQTRITGNHTTSLGRFVRGGARSDGRIEVAGVRASGPFTYAWAQQSQSSPFTTNLTLDAQSARIGGTSLTQLRVTAPLAVTSTPTAWRVSADVNLAAQKLASGDTRLNGLTALGPLVAATDSAGHIRLSSTKCLAFGARNGVFPGESSVGAVSGKLCPDRAGQLAILTDAAPRVFATTQIDPLAIQIGGPTGDQRIEIGDINGSVTTKPNGSLALNMLATQFAFSLKMPDGTIASIKANEAALNVLPKANGIGLQGRIGRVSSLGLPVLLSGDATADLLASPRGLGGTFNFDDIIVKDSEKSPRFGEMTLAGSGLLAGNQISIIADVREPASTIKMASITLSHDIGSGSGNLDVDANDLLMSPAPIRGRPGLDIVTLIPPLRGVVSDMVGVANISANIAWSRNAPIVSRAKIDTKGLDFGTMLGPITALTGEVNLDDLLAVRTPGNQTIKVGLFDPGLPIENGTVLFALAGNNTLRLEDASWPFAEGKLSVRPATWAFRDGDQSFSIDVEDVDLAKLLRLTEVPNLEIDGKVSGVFPIEVSNGNVEIVGGRLRAREGGGVIRYTGPNASPPPPPPGFFGRVRQRLFGKPAPAGADLAIEALRALEYKILEITVDGRITGELQMGVVLEGANQQVLSGQPFKFNIKMNVPVGQLLDNLNRLNNAGSSPEVLKEIDRVMREGASTTAVPNPPPPLTNPVPAP
jgi:hypothetical protein